MYPELKKAGGLANAINLEFKKLNSALSVSIMENDDKMPLTYARIEGWQQILRVG